MESAVDSVLAAVLSTVHTGLLVLDSDEVIVVANAATATLVGHEISVGRPFAEVAGLAQEARPGSIGRWSPRPGVLLEWSWTPLVIDGRSDGSCIALRDVSMRVAERARIRRQNRALAELVAMKAEFTAAVSHELRTPVTSIAALAELLSEDTPAGAPATDAVEAIGRNARRLLSLIDNVTELARVEAGGGRMPSRPVNLAEVARAAVAGWSSAAGKAGVPLTLSPPDDGRGQPQPVAEVRGDAAQLRRLVDAMIGLALATAEPGRPVEVTLRGSAQEWLLTVPLGGQGGERLFTSSPTTADGVRHDSTALMLCRAIVSRHAGRFTTDPTGPVPLLLAALPRTLHSNG